MPTIETVDNLHNDVLNLQNSFCKIGPKTIRLKVSAEQKHQVKKDLQSMETVSLTNSSYNGRKNANLLQKVSVVHLLLTYVFFFNDSMIVSNAAIGAGVNGFDDCKRTIKAFMTSFMPKNTCY